MMPVLLGLGGLALVIGAFLLARRFGVYGLILPGLVVAAAVWRGEAGPGHAEAVMGHGIEMMLIWLPLVVCTVVGAGLGLLFRSGRR